jgi:hypothetical protein
LGVWCKWSCLSTAGGTPPLGYSAGRVDTAASPGRPPHFQSHLMLVPGILRRRRVLLRAARRVRHLQNNSNTVLGTFNQAPYNSIRVSIRVLKIQWGSATSASSAAALPLAAASASRSASFCSVSASLCSASCDCSASFSSADRSASARCPARYQIMPLPVSLPVIIPTKLVLGFHETCQLWYLKTKELTIRVGLYSEPVFQPSAPLIPLYTKVAVAAKTGSGGMSPAPRASPPAPSAAPPPPPPPPRPPASPRRAARPSA